MSNTQLKEAGIALDQSYEVNALAQKTIEDLKDKFGSAWQVQVERERSLKSENEKLKEAQMKLDREMNDMIWDVLYQYGFINKNPLAPITDHIKILIDQVKSLEEEKEGLFDEQGAKDCFDLVDQEDLDEANEEIDKLEEDLNEANEEIEKLKETNEIRFDKIKAMEDEVGVSKLVHSQNLGLLEEIKKLNQQKSIKWSRDFACPLIEKLKAENEKLFKFTIGGGEESEVEKIIMEKMNKEFIDGNQEHWDDIGLFEGRDQHEVDSSSSDEEDPIPSRQELYTLSLKLKDWVANQNPL